MLKISPTTLKAKYVVELADGKFMETNHILNGCEMELSGHKFLIDLMHVTLGSFDVVIGMDWLTKNRAEMICLDKMIFAKIYMF